MILALSLSFLWQEAVVVLVSAGTVWLAGVVRRRILRGRLVRFFGEDALADPGVQVAISVLQPLATSPADAVELTRGYKLRPAREGGFSREIRPVYSSFMHLLDYDAFEEVNALLRHLGAAQVRIRADSDVVAGWNAYSCAICFGSPFVNVVMAEVIRAHGPGLAIDAVRTTDSLETYRLFVGNPRRLTLGVSDDRGLGVIARAPNPIGSRNSVVGVWGCRAESTFAAARYLRQHFDAGTFRRGSTKHLYGLARRADRFVLILAVDFGAMTSCRPMYLEQGHDLVLADESLLLPYRRES